MKKSAVLLLCLVAALIMVTFGPSLAGAYCVYNHSNTDLYVSGEQCTRCLQATVRAGDKVCCPGGDKGCRGHTRITISVQYSGDAVCNDFYVPKEVEAHGWVSFFGSCRKEWKTCDNSDACNNLRVKVHKKNGDVTYSGHVK